MKLFIDTANTEEIKIASDLKVISGVTTNPTLLMKSGKKLNDLANEILQLIDGPISVEVSEADEQTMFNQAMEIYEITNHNKNIVIKLPMTEDGLKVCRKLYDYEIKTNVTLVFTLNQAILAMEAKATYISPFMGRLEDYMKNMNAGFELIKSIREYRSLHPDITTKIIAASIRHLLHVEKAARAGADVATVPFEVLKLMYTHELTTKGLETFRKDEGK